MSEECRNSISVVIPCYNHGRFLAEAVGSVLAQTRPADEIIVVDDGSTDDTPEVAARYRPGVSYLRQENRGLSAARNAGMRQASGAFIAFLDADDLWQPSFLARLAPILESQPRLAAVHCGTYFMDVAGAVLPQRATKTVAPSAMFDALTGGEFFSACAVLACKAVLEECGGFDETLRAAEDWDLWLRVSRRYLFGGLADSLVAYRRHGENMSADLHRMLDSELAVVQKNFGSLSGDPTDWPQARRRACAAAQLNTALRYFQRDQTEQGSELLARAFRTLPDLAGRADVFYELGCADQPLGWRGDLASLDLDKNAALVETFLAGLFATAGLTPDLRSRRGTAYGTAYLALGLLAYGCGRLGAARRWLWRAAGQRPQLLFQRQWATTFGKTLLGSRVTGAFRRLAHG